MKWSAFRALKAFGNFARLEAAKELEPARCLEVVQATESAIDVIDVRCAVLHQANLLADRLIKHLNESELALMGDDGALASLFEDARDAIGRAHEKWSTKDICAVNEDGEVAQAYALLLTEVAALHNKLNTLYWIIREQEADQDRTLPGEFSSADELFAAMGV
jgi:hypothetical protein